MRITTTINYEGRRRHLAVTECYADESRPWALQWANPTEHGHSFEKPISLYRTKHEAIEAKRKILKGEAP